MHRLLPYYGSLQWQHTECFSLPHCQMITQPTFLSKLAARSNPCQQCRIRHALLPSKSQHSQSMRSLPGCTHAVEPMLHPSKHRLHCHVQQCKVFVMPSCVHTALRFNLPAGTVQQCSAQRCIDANAPTVTVALSVVTVLCPQVHYT